MYLYAKFNICNGRQQKNEVFVKVAVMKISAYCLFMTEKYLLIAFVNSKTYILLLVES